MDLQDRFKPARNSTGVFLTCPHIDIDAHWGLEAHKMQKVGLLPRWLLLLLLLLLFLFVLIR